MKTFEEWFAEYERREREQSSKIALAKRGAQLLQEAAEAGDFRYYEATCGSDNCYFAFISRSDRDAVFSGEKNPEDVDIFFGDLFGLEGQHIIAALSFDVFSCSWSRRPELRDGGYVILEKNWEDLCEEFENGEGGRGGRW